MGLIKCPDCGKEISDSATKCIGCGRPMKDAPDSVVSAHGGDSDSSASGLIGAFIAVVGFIVGVVAIFMESFLVGLMAIGIIIAGARFGAKYK